ncbi:uncharacterized protein B0I36DRAFT_252846 [Microdochium trichocladiopsis]|uniref:Leucine Rich Repeat domain-containing protein n=1 Tax=Microdochium trichocladiopsis TaxID=1682393 RepID=A0A9P8XVC8_9PEZI|nr:uncharacterized protein B0I36DRAFT_252846 [Microdochium trichocladiopsis]KAH7021181.1 hypothetical protein B0I36DRAFT_252846 [Microdochium trichocladiopsis]
MAAGTRLAGLLSPDNKSARSSFSSVREDDAGLAQSFTSSKISSFSHLHLAADSSSGDEAAIDDSSPPPSPPLSRPASHKLDTMATTTLTSTITHFQTPLTQPHSRLHGCWVPAVAADSFQGWKAIDVKGKLASRSFGDLQSLKVVWSAPSTPKKPRSPGRPAPGTAPIERLPVEILGPIIEMLVLDVPPNGETARNVDLMSLLLTSRTLHTATLNALYKNITIPHSRIFRKFLSHVTQNQELGTIVRRLDFSHFNPMSLFLSAKERASTRNLTPETLLQCLELTPHLREFLAQEYIDDEIDINVLKKLFFDLPRLKAVDLCGCSSALFRTAMTAFVQDDVDWTMPLSISRLSLHRCVNLPPAVFDTILPRLTNLTHLDVAGTRISDEALHSIPYTARITHLNLAKCNGLTADGIIEFLTYHPAVKDTLVYLSLAADFRSHQIFDEEDTSRLLAIMPHTLRSLSLKGSKMTPAHIPLLRPLTKHLEELALGRGLKVVDMDRLFVPDPEPVDEDEDVDMDGEVKAQLAWVPHTLKYLDLSDYIGGELDLSALFSSQCSIMKRHSAPLEVVEVADELYRRLSKSPVLGNAGWSITEFGSRAWIVRRPDSGAGDSGARSWKMGASYWGMRKVPVAVADVGGMYGSYMFKRGL